MDDNARPHRGHVVTGYLGTASIVRMDWSRRLPDLNPIEHAWDLLQRSVTALQRFLENRRELITALEVENTVHK